MTDRARFGLLAIVSVVGGILVLVSSAPGESRDGERGRHMHAPPEIGTAGLTDPADGQGPIEVTPAPFGTARIAFGRSLDPAGAVVQRSTRFRPGAMAFWSADLPRPAATQNVFFVIIQVLADGREFEHWRQEVRLADPNRQRLVGSADLFVYAHNGAGHYRMRYVEGEAILAEGEFDLVE